MNPTDNRIAAEANRIAARETTNPALHQYLGNLFRDIARWSRDFRAPMPSLDDIANAAIFANPLRHRLTDAEAWSIAAAVGALFNPPIDAHEHDYQAPVDGGPAYCPCGAWIDAEGVQHKAAMNTFVRTE